MAKGRTPEIQKTLATLGALYGEHNTAHVGVGADGTQIGEDVYNSTTKLAFAADIPIAFEEISRAVMVNWVITYRYDVSKFI